MGEMRDLETAEIAIKAAQTGHLVFSTLHTNNAISSLMRLYSLGIDNSLLEDSLIGVVSQRLTRKLCNYCKEKNDVKGELNYLFGENFFKNPIYLYTESRENECSHCIDGFNGRTVIYELWIIRESDRDLISQKCVFNSEYLKNALKNGMNPLVYNGMEKFLQGETSLSELRKKVVRVNDFRQHKDLLLSLIKEYQKI